MPQLRKLSDVYKRPLALFFLPKLPQEEEPLRDFRRLPGKAEQRISSDLQLEIRTAQRRREVALELHRELGEQPPQFRSVEGVRHDAEKLGLQIREFLDITYEEQQSWSGDYRALSGWRALLEQTGILVFQSSKVELSMMRGFSINESPLPIVAVNAKDTPLGRIFTMLHELGHLMLRSGGVCDLSNKRGRTPENQEMEVFCNHVAGATLVPKEHLLAHPVVAARSGRSEDWGDTEIDHLIRTYRVSREVIVRRLLSLGRTTQRFYRQKRQQYQKQYDSRPKGKPIVPQHTRVVSASGKPFVQLVLSAYHQERITASDVSDYLNVRLKHLDKIEAAVSVG